MKAGKILARFSLPQKNEDKMKINLTEVIFLLNTWSQRAAQCSSLSFVAPG